MLSRLLFAWASAALGLWVASKMLRGVRLSSFGDALWAGALLGLLQWALARPLFFALGIGTLGLGFLLSFLTRWVASALMVLLTSRLSSRLEVQGFGAAMITSLLVTVAGSVVRWLW